MTEAESTELARQVIHNAFGRDDYEYAVALGRLVARLMAENGIGDPGELELWHGVTDGRFSFLVWQQPDGSSIDLWSEK